VGSHSISEILQRFLEIPAIAHQESAIQARIKRANFRTEATLESYDWTRNPKTIRPEPFLELATGGFIRRKENVTFYGMSGLDLLIIDEFGFEKLERKEVRDALSLLYKVIDGRNRRSSTAVITNVSMSDWTDYLGDPPMTMALLDRVMGRSIQIPFKGKSGRNPIVSTGS